jgi:hypothetical protein
MSFSDPESSDSGSFAASRVFQARHMRRVGTRWREMFRRSEIRHKSLWYWKQRLEHRANNARDGSWSHRNLRDQRGLNGCCTAMWKANRKTVTLLLFLDSLFPKILFTIKRWKANWIGHILCRNCLLKYITGAKIEGRMEVTGGQGRRRKQLLEDLRKTRGHWKLKEESLHRALWRHVLKSLWTCRKTDFGMKDERICIPFTYAYVLPKRLHIYINLQVITSEMMGFHTEHVASLKLGV